MTEHIHEFDRVPKLAGSWIACIECGEPYRGPKFIELINSHVALEQRVEEMEVVKQIMNEPWSDSHDKGRDEAFKRLARISNALNLNDDPVTEDTPSTEKEA